MCDMMDLVVDGELLSNVCFREVDPIRAEFCKHELRFVCSEMSAETLKDMWENWLVFRIVDIAEYKPLCYAALLKEKDDLNVFVGNKRFLKNYEKDFRVVYTDKIEGNSIIVMPHWCIRVDYDPYFTGIMLDKQWFHVRYRYDYKILMTEKFKIFHEQ